MADPKPPAFTDVKQELLDALVRWIGVEQSASVRARLIPALSAGEFGAIWPGGVEWFLTHPDAYQFLQQVRDTGLISDAAVQEAAQSLSSYFEAIQKGLRAGAIKPYPADLIGRLPYQDMVAVLNHIRVHGDPNIGELANPAGVRGLLERHRDRAWRRIY